MSKTKENVVFALLIVAMLVVGWLIWRQDHEIKITITEKPTVVTQCDPMLDPSRQGNAPIGGGMNID